MKIICIGRNYVEHAKEMNWQLDEEPIIFMKPDTALLQNDKPFYLPDFSEEIHHEVELVLKINKEGKNIVEKFAYKYYDEISVGIDFTARDLQRKMKSKGMPWELAKAFDGSAPVGNFISKNDFQDIHALSFHLNINGNQVQKGNTKDLIFSFDTLLAFISKFITLRKGDLIFTGTPKGVSPVKIGDKLEAYIENQKLLSVDIK